MGVQHGDTTILIDAGFGPRTIARRAMAVAFPIESLNAVVVTHEHRDHAGGVAKLAAKYAVPVYATPGTLRALDGELQGIETIAVSPNCRFSLGAVTIDTCPVPHDAREPIAVAVNDSVGSRVAVAYDLGHVTERVVRFLSGSSAIVIEANHDNQMLYAGPYPSSVRARIAGTRGHLSNDEAGTLFGRVYHKGLQWAMLAHLSQNCNTTAIALKTVSRVANSVGFRGALLATQQDQPTAALSVGKPTQLSFRLGA